MLSPLLQAIDDQFRMTILTSYQPLWRITGDWMTIDDLNELYRRASERCQTGSLIFIPKMSLSSSRFALAHLKFPIVAALSECYGIDTVKGAVLNADPKASYLNKARALTVHLLNEATQLGERSRPISSSNNDSLSLNKWPVIVIAPFVSWESRRWDTQKWAELLSLLISQMNASVIIVGNENERQYGEEIILKLSEASAVTNLMGKTTISELSFVLESADIVVSVDNGLMHLAASTETPLVAIFGSTPFDARVDGVPNVTVLHGYLSCRIAPCYSHYAKVYCPFSHQCIQDVSVTEVFKAVTANISTLERRDGRHMGKTEAYSATHSDFEIL